MLSTLKLLYRVLATLSEILAALPNVDCHSHSTMHHNIIIIIITVFFLFKRLTWGSTNSIAVQMDDMHGRRVNCCE